MIRINWQQVSDLKTKLKRQGANDKFELIIIVLYHTSHESDRIRVRLSDLEESLFRIESNRNIKGIFLYDSAVKKPYLRFREEERVNILEKISDSGHRCVISQFTNMSQEAKETWVNIAYSQLLHYLERIEAPGA